MQNVNPPLSGVQPGVPGITEPSSSFELITILSVSSLSYERPIGLKTISSSTICFSESFQLDQNYKQGFRQLNVLHQDGALKLLTSPSTFISEC